MPEFEIKISGLKLYAHHGVLEFEKQLGQEFLIDAEVLVTAGVKDKLEESVSYADLAELLVSDAKSNPVDLIETLALRLQQKLIAFSPLIRFAKVTVHKPGAPMDYEFADVSVSYQGER